MDAPFRRAVGSILREIPPVFGGLLASFGEQAGQILAGVETELRKHRPDRLLILGDTNSGLSAVVARRLGVPPIRSGALA